MDFNASPYWDDFEASNGAKDQNYMRILFRPGYAVQARELTQIQSIVQNQIKQFGDHIFKDGSPVYGGQITLDNSLKYLKLEKTYNGIDVDLENFENRVIFNSTGTAKIRAKVVTFDDTQTQPTLMVRYLRGTEFPNGNVIQTSGNTNFAQLVSANSSGIGSVASISEGVFYVDGYFVKVAPQTIVLDAYSSAPTFKVGLEIDDEIIDESADQNLLDPAQESFNYQAPGAHRFKFALNLAKRRLDSVDDSRFFELLRVENGLITKQVKYPIYSEIEKTLARRTFDESGDYTVKPFSISLASNTACSNVFVVNIEPGKAYVKGFEFETQGTQKIEVPKARTTNTSIDYDLSVEFGNYLYANNVAGSANGLFDTTNLETLELHCVPRASINTTGTVGYNTTFMGTARVRDFVRDSSTEYILYLTDINLVSNTVTAASTGTSNTIVFPSTYSTLDNAYANVAVRVLSGNSSGDVRKIISYDGTTKTATVDLPFTGLVGSGNTVSLLYDNKDIDSIVEVISTKAAFNVAMDVSNSSKGITGDTIIYDGSKTSLIFMLPETYVANNTINNADYVYNKFFGPKTFTSNGQFDLTLSGNETYDYGSDGSFLSTTSANNNLIVMVKSLGTASNVSVGQIINLNGALAGVRRDSSTQLTIFTGANGTFTADIYARVKVNNSESASNNRRTKTVRGNTAITTLRTTDSPTNGTSVIGASNIKIDTGNAFIWFTNTADINKVAGGNNSLYIPDVYKIIKIYDSGNPAHAPNTTNAIDITSKYYLDSGQTLSYYDHSKITLKPGVAPPKGQIVAMVQYYEHSTGIRGYFSVDSYPASQYDTGAIPIFIAPGGASYNLRDAIDFRPTRDIGTSSSIASYTFIGSQCPDPDEAMELSYSYYVPRIDKVVITKDKELKTITGVASKFPSEPFDSENAMTLYKLFIPAYTPNPADITVTPIDNRRYTMKDIGKIEARLKNLEYYTALNTAEKRATDTTILYEDNATQKEKYGIVADNFSGFNIADTRSPDFLCSIEKGVLGPYNNIKQIPMVINQVGNNLQRNDKTITLQYSEEIIISQTSATSNVSVQPYLYGKFDGNIRLTPASDNFFSIQLQPIVISPIQILPPVFTPPQPPDPPVFQDFPVIQPTFPVFTSQIEDIIGTTTFVSSGAFGAAPQVAIMDWIEEPRTSPVEAAGGGRQFDLELSMNTMLV